MAAYPVLCVPRTCTSFVIFFLGYWQWKNSPTAFGKQSKSSNSTALSKISTQSSTIWSNHRCLSSHHLENSRERERENSRLESHSGSCIDVTTCGGGSGSLAAGRSRAGSRRWGRRRLSPSCCSSSSSWCSSSVAACGAGGADGWEAIGAAAAGRPPQGRVAGRAGGGRRRVAPQAPPLPRPQLPLPDRLQGRCARRFLTRGRRNGRGENYGRCSIGSGWRRRWRVWLWFSHPGWRLRRVKLLQD